VLRFLAGPDAHRLWRPQRFIETYFRPSGHVLHRRRLPPRRGRLLLDHRPRRRRDQRLRPPHRHGRGRERAGRAPKVAEAAVVGYPHDIKGQGIYAYVTLKPASSRARSCARNSQLGAQGDRPRSPRPTDPVGAGPARRRAPARSCAASCARSPPTTRAAGRHLDPGRSVTVPPRGRFPPVIRHENRYRSPDLDSAASYPAQLADARPHPDRLETRPPRFPVSPCP
jgi:hypothetical protein